ncbi:unnamed protein product [Psylliodes chrysocephalus]|uniref:C2H2-type domain-containing protein n=1 Tax=Psylliodes chrysocephalus TaxID=3402493 RepID=A0A9P0CSA3_9CUCU|nr:unnamed protein product [Psylliodes chrysocephala]
MVNLYHCFQFYDYSFSPHKIMFAVRLPALTVSAGAIPKAQSPKHYKTYGKRDRNHCEYCHVSFDTFPGLRQHEVKTHKNEESKKKQRPVNQRWRYSKTLLLEDERENMKNNVLIMMDTENDDYQEVEEIRNVDYINKQNQESAPEITQKNENICEQIEEEMEHVENQDNTQNKSI